MGGHLLHHFNLPEKRLSRAEFNSVCETVVAKLENHLLFNRGLCGMRVTPLRFFERKESFGDCDIAVEILPGPNVNWNEDLKDLFGYKPYKNGNVYSFPVDGFQVDLMMFPSELYDCALNYYAFETGNFMGRIADKMGLSYGHRGLYLKLPLSYFSIDYPAHEFREILITRDADKIFRILGFNYSWFVDGFNDFDEMSKWVAESRHFDPELFAFESLNSINRTRNRKRPVYAAFVEWCKSQPKKVEIHPNSIREALLKGYPHISKEINDERDLLFINEVRRNKFNGNIVRELTGLEGKDLGDFIVDFKRKRGNFECWLDAHSADEVKKEILK